MIDQPYRLTLTPRDNGPSMTTLVKGAVLVGRSDHDSNHVPDLDLKPLGAWNAGVSRRHLVMNPFDETTFFIKDLGSANGTRINGGLLKAGMVYSLHSGDLLTVGTLHLTITFSPVSATEMETSENDQVEGGLLRHSAEGFDTTQEDPNTTIVRRSRGMSETLLEVASSATAESHLTPDERAAVDLLRQIVSPEELSEDITFYIARDAVRNPYWRRSHRIAVLQAASTYGYIRRDHPELVQEQQRLNRQSSRVD